MKSLTKKIQSVNYVALSTLMHSSALLAITLAPQYFPEMLGSENPQTETIEFTVASLDPVKAPAIVKQVTPPKSNEVPDKTEVVAVKSVAAKETPVQEESPVEVAPPAEDIEKQKLEQQLAELEAAKQQQAEELAELKSQQEAAQKAAAEEAKAKAEEELAAKQAAADAAAAAAAAKQAKAEAGTGNSPEKIVVKQDYLQLRQMPGNTPPLYSENMRLQKIQGRGQLVYQVTKSGAVADVRLTRSTGHPELDQAAINAFKKYRFVPGQEGRTVHNFEFSLKGPAKAAGGGLRTSGRN